MKKKKALSLVMAAVLALGVVPGVSVWAEDTDSISGFSVLDEDSNMESVEEGFTSDIGEANSEFEAYEETEDENTSMSDELLEAYGSSEDSGISKGDYNGRVTNVIAYNTCYNFSDMTKYYGYDAGYRLDVNFPKDGRAKILVEDCYTEEMDKGFNIEGLWSHVWNYAYSSVGIDSIDSGWVTVKPGRYVFVINGYPNAEAKVTVQYEDSSTYYGEKEDNDTFDTANLLENNVIYEANGSKDGDYDYYKFEMEQAGLADIKVSNFGCVLYSEDEHGNVSKIRMVNEYGEAIKDEMRVRLAAGSYFLRLTPSVSSDEGREYTVCVNKQYESAEDFEQESNNVKSLANEKQTNHWYTGNLNTLKDVDYYKFTISEDSFLALEFKIPRESDYRKYKVSLYDNNLDTPIAQASTTSDPYLKLKECLCKAGTYFVRVESGLERENGFSFFNDYSLNLNQRPYKYVTAISIPVNKTVTEGESFTLTPEITPSDAEDPSVTWSSSNPYVATVDEKGNVTAKAVGTTDIVVTAADRGTVSATCTLTVQERVIKYVTEIGIAGEKSVKQGTAFSVAPVITPGDAENKALRWQSSNPAVVEVDSNGNMMANRCGTARITVTAQDRDMVSASCVVTVYNTVRYNLNGGTNNGGNPSTFYGNTTNLLNPTRRGYTFSGWYSDKGFKKKVTQITSGNVGNTTFYAKWKKVSVRKTTITSFANKSGKKALVKYKAISGASGYEIVYSTDKKVKKNRTTVKTKAKSRTLKGLKKGKTYYVKVRAYKTDSTGLVVYGKYSAIKKVKIKK